MEQQPSSPLYPLFSITAWSQRLVFWCGAILVGLTVVCLVLLSEWAGQFFKQIHERLPWASFLLCPFGLTFTAWLTFRFFPGAERSGIPQVKAALEITGDLSQRRALISTRIAVGKTFLPIFGLLSGASVGLGGPAAQIGASLMASLAKVARFPTHFLEKGLILAGSSAGFAAMFSAPLTGIVFAVEEMGRALEDRISSLVLTAIIFAGVTAYALLNSYIFFDDRSLFLPRDQSWFAIPICGIIGGLAGGLFSSTIIGGCRTIEKHKIPPLPVAFLSGLVIAITGYLSDGHTFGTGYQETSRILQNNADVDTFYPLLKMISVIATVFSGIPAGLFVPSLATGAGLGADLSAWFPMAPAAAIVLLTTTAYFSGMLQSPMTSFVLIMEITDTHEILIPLMATAIFATGTSKLVCPTPLYRALSDSYKPPAPESKQP